MSSALNPDPVALGLASSIIISLIITIPLLWIFLRIRSRPSSFMWKAIYVPRTWWPGPSQRVHPIFDPLPGGSPYQFLMMLLKGSTFQQSSPKLSSRQSANDEHPSFMTDEEIHLRFLTLCLRLALLALLLGLPTFFALFIAGVPPPSPESPKTSYIQNFTLLRLLFQYDLTPVDLTTRLIIWSISALLIGVVISFLLILFEWHYLRVHLQRFFREKCGGLQIVFFPRKPHSGFESVGEKKMANWVRACGLGPVGQEGSGVALSSNTTHGASPQKHSQPQKLGPSNGTADERKTADVDSDAVPLRNSTHSNQLPKKVEAPLRSEHRGIIIQGIFTISRLESLYSLSEKRRKIIDDLEMNESKYVAGFLPENLADASLKKPKRDKNPNKFRNRSGEANEALEEQVTPYGPLGLYKLDHRPRETCALGWDDPSLRLSRFVSNLTSSHTTLAEKPSRGEEGSEVKSCSEFRFGEIIQGPHLTNHIYQDKWAIGDEVVRQDDGTFQNVTKGKPASLKSHKSHRASDQESQAANLGEPSEEKPQAAELVADSELVVGSPSVKSGGSRRPSLANSRVGSWPAPGHATPSSIASTDDTHGYPASTSTAPTSASLNHFNSKQTLRDNNNNNNNNNNPSVPAVTLTDLIEQEASRPSRLSFPLEPPPNSRHLHLLTQSVSSPNLLRSLTAGRTTRRNGDQNSEGSGIIPYLFQLPETVQNLNSRPMPMQSLPTHTNKNHTMKLKISNPIKKITSGTGERDSKKKVKPHRFMNAEEIEMLYHSIRKNRSELKRLNQDFQEEKRKAVEEMEEGSDESVFGWILVGKGVELIDGALPIDGMTREDINWSSLGKKTRLPLFWILFLGIFLLVGIIIIAVTFFSMAAIPELPNVSPFFALLRHQTGLELGLISITAPSILLFLLLYSSLSAISYLAINLSGLPSKTASHLLAVKAIFLLISGCFLVWFLVCASMIDLTLLNEGATVEDIDIIDRFSRGILALSDSFLSFQCILAVIVPTLILVQPGRWMKVKSALQSPQTPRQRVLSLWPQQMNSALCRGSSLMAVSILLLFSSIAPLTILPSVIFFGYMIVVQQRNVHYVYKRDSQSGGKTELQMVFMLSILLVLHSIFLAVILASRQQWALTALAGSVGLFILTMTCLMIYQDLNMGGKRGLPAQSKKALAVFEAGPGGKDYIEHSESATATDRSSDSRAGRSADSKKETLFSVFQLVHTKFRSSEVKHHRPVPLPSESVDHLVDTRLALQTYPDAPPHLPYLAWGSSQVYSRDMLYPPVLLQTSPAIWLPKNGAAAEEAHDLKKYWDLDAFYEEGIPTQHLNLL
ncbi:hypothetical protein PCASD_07856 [Puccinia coronata f. sp. avenae]|uniref:CSC1/OSCA1-like 7TM region domain-containing protein n=1 Tax=Puccinia coronata f. sp. avenae TaxID=200324 RepID=A0A2N5UQU3_9BASI|nr:hypothetical protein PCASD_07856 [Puccinia coronata f. sp. avenae]